MIQGDSTTGPQSVSTHLPQPDTDPHLVTLTHAQAHVPRPRGIGVQFRQEEGSNEEPQAKEVQTHPESVLNRAVPEVGKASSHSSLVPSIS